MESKPEAKDERSPAPEQDNATAPETKDMKKKQENAEEATDPAKPLEDEIAALKEQRIRALAEVENMRKRAQRDQEEIAKYAISAFARDMVEVLENLTRATESIKEHEGKTSEELLKTLGEGVELTQRELVNIFNKFQIKRIAPMNEKFDHNFHQAIAQVERDDVAPGTVVQVVQAGYTIHDRLLRPAMVAVSKQGGDAPKTVDTSA